MVSPKKLSHRYNDALELAQSTLARFEQLLLLLPLPSAHDIPALHSRLCVDLSLPDSEQTHTNITVSVTCLLRQPGGQCWLGLAIIDDQDSDIEQRIRRLTHTLTHEYGRLIGKIFT